MGPEGNLGLGVGLNFERQKVGQSMNLQAAGVKCGVVLVILFHQPYWGSGCLVLPHGPQKPRVVIQQQENS